MKVIYGAGNLKTPLKQSCVAIGVFDGVHRGHQKIISAMVKKAKAMKVKSVVMTFDPHPAKVLHTKNVSLLNTLDQRIVHIAQLGVDMCLVVSFNKRFAATTPERFVERYLVQMLGAKAVFVGQNFRFGQNRAGHLKRFKTLGQEHGFSLHVPSAVKNPGGVISSTRIRQAIARADFKNTDRMLGRRFAVMGRVVKGDQRGRRLGFPTANIKLINQLLPPTGVYIVEVVINSRRYKAMANFGVRPSFKSSSKYVLEVHILDYQRNLYNQEVLLVFHKKIRAEHRFASQEQLIHQLQKDERQTRSYFKKLS